MSQHSEVSLNDFYDMLEKHDWYYEFSDDHRAWKKGRLEYQKIKAIAAISPEYRQLHEDWTKHMFTGGPWKNEQAPKPERPE